MNSVIEQSLSHRFEEIDYAQAKSDVLPFIRDPAAVGMWNSEFFRSVTRDLAAL